MHWSPRVGETAALAAVGGALVLLGMVGTDLPGGLLVGAAGLLLLGLAGRDLLLRPRLAAGADGVVVRTLAGRRRLSWPELRVGVRSNRRFGVRSRTLELDTATGPEDPGILVLLGRRDLGADPDDVARALRALDPTAV